MTKNTVNKPPCLDPPEPPDPILEGLFCVAMSLMMVVVAVAIPLWGPLWLIGKLSLRARERKAAKAAGGGE